MPRTEAPHPELFDPVTPIADINLEQAPALEFFYFFPRPLVGLEVELLRLDRTPETRSKFKLWLQPHPRGPQFQLRL